MVVDRETAARNAEASKSAKVGMCQQWTRTMFLAPSVGDIDLDGDADAVDGWKKERRRHFGDRNPPRGVPLTWSGGSRGHGHRAISLGNGRVRSIDVAGPGTVGTVSLDWFEEHWGMKYLGWSNTISAIDIPMPEIKPVPKPKPPTSRRKTTLQIAREVVDGKWGSGDERKKRLAAAGYSYREVQAKVNQLLR